MRYAITYTLGAISALLTLLAALLGDPAAFACIVLGVSLFGTYRYARWRGYDI